MALNYHVTCWHLCSVWCQYLLTERVKLLPGQTQARWGPNCFRNDFSPPRLRNYEVKIWLLYSLKSVVLGNWGLIDPSIFLNLAPVPTRDITFLNIPLFKTKRKLLQYSWKLNGSSHLTRSFLTNDFLFFVQYSVPAFQRMEWWVDPAV